jgi:predicted nucleic acid-binding protein
MSDIALVDATTLIGLGSVGRVDLLENFDAELRVPETVRAEVTTEPARTNVEAFLDAGQRLDSDHAALNEAGAMVDTLGDDRVTGDAVLLAAVRHFHEQRETVAVVSDDRRVRTVARGLGATVTGTAGVVVRAVHEGMPAEDAKSLVRDIDSHGLHMTGELREKAFDLIDEAATD